MLPRVTFQSLRSIAVFNHDLHREQGLQLFILLKVCLLLSFSPYCHLLFLVCKVNNEFASFHHSNNIFSLVTSCPCLSALWGCIFLKILYIVIFVAFVEFTVVKMCVLLYITKSPWITLKNDCHCQSPIQLSYQLFSNFSSNTGTHLP